MVNVPFQKSTPRGFGSQQGWEPQVHIPLKELVLHTEKLLSIFDKKGYSVLSAFPVVYRGDKPLKTIGEIRSRPHQPSHLPYTRLYFPRSYRGNLNANMQLSAAIRENDVYEGLTLPSFLWLGNHMFKFFDLSNLKKKKSHFRVFSADPVKVEEGFHPLNLSAAISMC